MSTLDASSQSPRSTLVAEIRQRLDSETFPRVIVLVMLTVAGAAAFLCSAVALDGGIESMPRRYALATASGYLVFLLLIRVWISVRRGYFPDGADACDLAETACDVAPVAEAGPSSGEGLVDAAAHGFDWSFDLDDLWWLALIVLVAAAGLITVALVVYAAPVLLAEVALDAALVGTVYRRLRAEDRGYWATTALRRTWISAVVLVAFMAVVGFALQQSTPDAVSIGDVVRRVLAR
jgi:hypothetical protein